MEQNSIWHFSRMAYRQGLFSDLLSIIGGMLPPGISMLEMVTAMEDWAVEADVDALDRSYERLEPLIGAMAQEEVVVAVKDLLAGLMPLVEKMGGVAAVIQTIQGLIPTLRDHAAALPTVLRAIIPVLGAGFGEGGMAAKAGTLAGDHLMKICRGLNAVHAQDPQAVKAFAGAFIGAIEPQVFRQSADILAGVILDHRPPLARWTFKTVVARLKKRFIP